MTALSLVILPWRHFHFAIALAVILFFAAHVSPLLTLGIYLLCFVAAHVALFGAAALLLRGRLGPLLKRFGTLKR